MTRQRRRKIEVTISVIIHATENSDIILDALSELGVKNDAFESTKTTGHFDNIIMIYDAKITGKDARHFVQKFTEMSSDDSINALIRQSPERTSKSKLHIRIDKQVLIREQRLEIINLDDDDNQTHSQQQQNNIKDVIKIKIHTPIYNKKEIMSTFEDVLCNS